MKKFNITGLCVENKHYMVDIKDKLKKIEVYIENGEYFTINRPRQYGKTTTINQINKYLSNKYFIIEISFEGLGDYTFKSEERFCESFVYLLNSRVENSYLQDNLKVWYKDLDLVNNFELLSKK
ncbi:MAG: AAA family ATPase, partial [Clostridiales bacterium]